MRGARLLQAIGMAVALALQSLAKRSRTRDICQGKVTIGITSRHACTQLHSALDRRVPCDSWYLHKSSQLAAQALQLLLTVGSPMNRDDLSRQELAMDPSSSVTPALSAAIDLDSVVKTLGTLRAVDDVSLHIAPGEIFGLIGPNGSGKTTLIRLILGLLHPTSGSVRILNHRISDQKIASAVGYMTQASALYSELSIAENLTFFGELYGLHGRRLHTRTREVLELVDLTERAHSPIQTLSGGMRQRVSLAISLVHQPRLLVLDEPTVGIDPELRRTFWDYFGMLAGRESPCSSRRTTWMRRHAAIAWA